MNYDREDSGGDTEYFIENGYIYKRSNIKASTFRAVTLGVLICFFTVFFLNYCGVMIAEKRASSQSRNTAHESGNASPESLNRNRNITDCNTGNSCAEAGRGFAEQNDYEKAAVFYRKSCDYGHYESCRDLVALYYENKAQPSPHDDPPSLLSKACSYYEPAGCFMSGGVLLRYYPDDAVKQKEAFRFITEACDYGFYSACGQKAESLLAQGRPVHAYRTAVEGCRRDDVRSCAIQTVISLKYGMSDISKPDKYRRLNRGCYEAGMDEVCFLYALELPDSSAGDRVLAMENACRISPDSRYCKLADLFREKTDSETAPDLKSLAYRELCLNKDMDYCFRLAARYEQMPALSPEARREKAADVYLAACGMKNEKACDMYRKYPGSGGQEKNGGNLPPALP